MPYERIEDYGLIGNMRTAALVSRCGSIDWMCYPRFDSPSVFAAMLDDGKGGRFRLGPTVEGVTYKQMYLPDTNVLITRFLSEDGVGEVEDYMPVRPGLRDEDNQLVRRVKVMRGSVPLELICEPALDYARVAPKTTLSAEGARFDGPEGPFFLSASIPLQQTAKGVSARFTLNEGDNATFTFKRLFDGEPRPITPEQSQGLFEETVRYWRQWLSQSTYRGRWREAVNRSALALKLLTYEPTGALIASPTCGLPERVGGERNWDYRYTWIRDSAFTLYALLRIGFKAEAMGFLGWLKTYALKAPGDSLQVAYGIDGRRELPETELPHLDGYRGSRPVRIGNAAHSQLQLDIYGELMDAVYLYNKHATPISSELWARLRSLVNWVCDHWQEKDRGVWETRGDAQHFVYSKLMCWVAVDRAIRLADKRSFPADRARWLAVRDEIYEEILAKGWSEQHQAFTLFYGSEALDSSCLIMPLVFFMSPADPKLLSTLDAIASPARKGGLLSDGLLYRYDPEVASDGLSGDEGTFNMCTFWMVEAMTRAGRADPKRLERARLLFERVLGYANHVGLYSEQIGKSGEALGNFPQAFAHLALISSAYNLDRALDGV